MSSNNESGPIFFFSGPWKLLLIYFDLTFLLVIQSGPSCPTSLSLEAKEVIRLWGAGSHLCANSSHLCVCWGGKVFLNRDDVRCSPSLINYLLLLLPGQSFSLMSLSHQAVDVNVPAEEGTSLLDRSHPAYCVQVRTCRSSAGLWSFGLNVGQHRKENGNSFSSCHPSYQIQYLYNIRCLIFQHCHT